MKRYVYPAIVYSDEDDSFTVFFPDLGIIAEGSTAEEAYVKAKDMMKDFFELSNKYSSYIPDATPFDDIQSKNPNKKVMLIDVELKDKGNNEPLTDSERRFIEFSKLFYDEDK